MTADPGQDTAGLRELIESALRAAEAEIDAVAGVESGLNEPGRPFWYVRVAGETKQHFSVEFTLGQRTLVAESYFMPDPEENREAVFEHLLVRNRSMYPLQFCIGAESAVYLRAQVDNRDVDSELIDRLLAAVYEYTEAYFVTAMTLGFASRFFPAGSPGQPDR